MNRYLAALLRREACSMVLHVNPPIGWAPMGAVLLLALASNPPGVAQSLPTPVLKAVFLYNFTKFTEWPADALTPAAPLELCVADDPDVAEALTSLAKGHTLGDHPLTVRRVKPDGALRGCHVLYASGLDRRGCLALLATVIGWPMLTITDNQEFAELGGHVTFFLEHDRIRFSINVGATRRARVTVSSRLLALAKIVSDQSNPR
jgi:YfiR/HmsC-like